MLNYATVPEAATELEGGSRRVLQGSAVKWPGIHPQNDDDDVVQVYSRLLVGYRSPYFKLKIDRVLP